ncbi:uncharacterized protein HMPREF1541_02812 [Cyphellophora europaea CBS 101466]|uniref:Amine oxidase domain-containing protein n=1 Tax=Cyphellophora europaea (strain CBS 101466) TaxID=1220924 RepID=W2S6J2_CYPE1|nr:uncharacterized protein HMPREF1541_02812 [Cyphellophora europaea CBS 101466]ETN43653.1 hypothetical protein HMPREF1541_02812 [Cyphellophora europaea CBS 101466]
MSRIAKDLAKAAPWHVHPRPALNSGPSASPGWQAFGSSSPSSTPITNHSPSGGSSPTSYSTSTSTSTAPSTQPFQDVNVTAALAASAGASACNSPSIAIIGAGIASLRLATLLLRSLPPTATLTIFEARSRIGGRLAQTLVGDHLVDLGANWIHGVAGNPIAKLAERTGTSTLEPEESCDIFDERGRRMSVVRAAETAGLVWEGVVDAFRFSDEHGDAVPAERSLYEWFEERFTKLSHGWEGSEADREIKLRDVLNETHMWGPFVGDPIERQSLKFFWMEECIDGGNVFVADTYRKILREVAKPALDAGIVRFDSEATGIEVLEADQGVKVTLRNGEQSAFDEVVCTAPLGWLKRNKSTAFTPRLPKRIDAAIDNISYGRLEKLYISFPEAFWLEEASPSTITSPPNAVSGSSADKSRDPPTTRPLALFTHFHHPSPSSSYHPSIPPTESPPTWNQNLVSLAHLPGSAAQPTLLFYVYGACATTLVKSVRGLEVQGAEYNRLLWNFARPWLAKLPGYREGGDRCRPVERGMLVTQWQNDEFAGNGSYANFQVGLQAGDEDVEAMRDCVGLTKESELKKGGEPEQEVGQKGPRKGGLWLAGEHTAPVVALGTTTGAWWSGEGVARRICKKWGVQVVEDEDVGVEQEEVREKVEGERLSGGGPGGLVKGTADDNVERDDLRGRTS